MERSTAILILDDDEDVLRAARVALAPEVERVVTNTSLEGLEALLAEQEFGAVLLDMNFAHGQRNGAAGLDGLARIRACDPEIAVVLMTAYGSLALAVDALKQGAADFILKPWRNDKLLAAAHAALELTRARREASPLNLDSLERGAIERALAQHRGNISLAAAALGLSRPALYRRMAKYGLQPP